MNPARWWVPAVGSLLLFTGVATAQSPHVIEAPNFLGKNVCMTVERPAGLNPQIPFPIVRMETELGHRDADYPRSAKYSIAFGSWGTISIDEELASDSTCANLPLDFVWRDAPDGLSSTTRFCLPGADGKRKVHVQGSVLASAGALATVKRALVGIAACRMTLFPSPYDSRDAFSNGERLQVGPYLLAR